MSEPVCYRHPDRVTHIACQRCDRPICPACMTEAAVGFQCPNCVQRGNAKVRQPRTIAGGTVPANPGIVSTVIIAVNVLIFFIVEATGGSLSSLYRDGAMLAETTRYRDDVTARTGFVDGAWWRPLTSAFLHGGLLHLAFNMLAIYIFGTFLERALGLARFIAAYIVSLLGASLLVLWLTPSHVMTVGASGAVYGLFAIALIMLIKARQDVRFLLGLLAINLLISFTGNISWQAHLGGFAVGAVLGLLYAYTPREWRNIAHWGVTAALGITLATLLYLPLLG